MSSDPQIGKYVPLTTIISYYLDQYSKGEGDRDELWIIGLRALVELNFDISAEPETFRLPVSGNKTVPFPPSCLSWSKIGILNEKGEMSTLKINNALTTFKDTNPNRLSHLTPDINDGICSLTNTPMFLNYFYNGGYYNLFGVGGGLVQYGECRVDDKNDIVILNEDFKYDSIMFECISAPQRDGDYKVLLALQESIIAFIAWKKKMGTSQEFYAEVIKSRRRMPGKKVTLQHINQVIRESSGMYLHA